MLALFSLPQASTLAANTDRLFNFITFIDVVSFLGVIGAIIYFIHKYRRSKSDPEKTPYIEGHPIAEASIMVGLFILVMVMFAWGWIDYVKMRAVPADAMEVNVTGRQWMWNFEYLNGRRLVNEVTVPKGRPVKFVMTSIDVLHSFFIPDFRVKQDVVPGTYTYLWFNAKEVGDYQVFCAEYCGTTHSGMLAKVHVVEASEYDRWQKKWEWEKQLGVKPTEDSDHALQAHQDSQQSPAENLTPAERGKKLFTSKGCNACHGLDGKVLVGPPLNKLFGTEVELSDGKK